MNYENIKSAFSRQLGRGVHVLVEFSHSKFTDTFRLIDNTESVLVEGDTFEPYPFKFVQSTQGETSGASIILSNIDRTIVNELKKATDNESIVCTVWIANVEKVGDTLNVDRYSAGTFEVFSPVVTIDSTSLSLNLRISLDYNVGSLRYSPVLFRNLYL